MVANLAKGGVVKIFDRPSGDLVLNDCGVIGRLQNGKVISSQWIDREFQCRVDAQGWTVNGYLQEVPSNRVFNPLRGLLFRTVLVALGWSSSLSHLLKGRIRKSLMLGSRRVPVRFMRQFEMKEGILITDELQIGQGARVVDLAIGGEFFVRYVPQSRYFQSQELMTASRRLSAAQLETLNTSRKLVLRYKVE